MIRPPSKTRAVYSTTYPPQPRPMNQGATYGHYDPSQARVQFLVDHALTWGLDGFWESLALRYMTIQPPFSPWNEANLVADTILGGSPENIEIIHRVLYRGRIGEAKVKIAEWDKVQPKP